MKRKRKDILRFVLPQELYEVYTRLGREIRSYTSELLAQKINLLIEENFFFLVDNHQGDIAAVEALFASVTQQLSAKSNEQKLAKLTVAGSHAGALHAGPSPRPDLPPSGPQSEPLLVLPVLLPVAQEDQRPAAGQDRAAGRPAAAVLPVLRAGLERPGRAGAPAERGPHKALHAVLQQGQVQGVHEHLRRVHRVHPQERRVLRRRRRAEPHEGTARSRRPGPSPTPRRKASTSTAPRTSTCSPTS